MKDATGDEGIPESPRSVRTNHTGRLILAPRDPQACPDREPLLGALSAAAFIADPIPGREYAFSVGPDFLELIAFVGCAVAVETDPLAGGAFCHVLIPPASGAPRWCHGRNTRAPRCPGCRHRLVDWQARGEAWAVRPAADIACPSCGQSRPFWQWDWKQQGGFARRMILVEEIFPGEAVPAQSLLDLLERTSGCDWHYFYAQD
jgi:hypothetical protein